jgi:hypothetical protein
MALDNKYKELIDTAKSSGVYNLEVREENNVLYIDGTAPSGNVKDELWATYNRIDPDFRAADLIMNVDVAVSSGSKATVATESSNLNIRKGPGTDQEIVGKAAHNAVVTVLSKTNDQWVLIKTDDGVEGYVYTQYLDMS